MMTDIVGARLIYTVFHVQAGMWAVSTWDTERNVLLDQATFRSYDRAQAHHDAQVREAHATP